MTKEGILDELMAKHQLQVERHMSTGTGAHFDLFTDKENETEELHGNRY